MKRRFVYGLVVLLVLNTLSLSLGAANNMHNVTDANFTTVVGDRLFFLTFSADWCPPCRSFGPHFEATAKKFPDLNFSRIDVDQNRRLSSQFEVKAIPHIIAVKDGKKIEVFSGSRTTQGYSSWVKSVAAKLPSSASLPTKSPGTQEPSKSDAKPAPKNTAIQCSIFDPSPRKIVDVKALEVKDLPEEIDLWVSGNQVANTSVQGWEKRSLPIYNLYRFKDGIYVAVYSRHREGSIYSVGGGIYVMGLIRVKGTWDGRIARPIGFERSDISTEISFKEMANRYFPATKGEGWVGGDTGGFFGR